MAAGGGGTAFADSPDGDGDGIPDIEDVCPHTIFGVSVDANGCPPAAPGDFDRDGDVDANDWALMEPCVSGPGVISDPSPTCGDADFDLDADVDLSDVVAFGECFSGAGVPSDPDCVATVVEVSDGCLRIVGTDAGASLVVGLDPVDSTLLTVNVDGTGPSEFAVALSEIACIQIWARRGNDVILMDESNGAFTNAVSVMIDAGDGDDEVHGGIGPELIIGGGGDDFVDGGPGADVAMLGAGDDTFRWEPGDGSDVVEGQGDSDTLDFNGSGASENVLLSANGSRVRLFRDVANVTMDCNQIEQVKFHALGGADIITVQNLAGTGVNVVHLDLAGTINGSSGDGAADIITVVGTTGADAIHVIGNGGVAELSGLAALVRVANGEVGNDVLAYSGAGGDSMQFDGSSGDDSFDVFAPGLVGALRVTMSTFTTPVEMIAVTGVTLNGMEGADMFFSSGNIAGTGIPLVYDGGDGDDEINGGNGADLLIGGDGNDLIDGNQGADLALMGADDDTFQWDPGDGNDVVEGQEGNNTLDFRASNASEIIDLSANGGRLRLTRNVGNIVMDCNDIQQVVLRMLGGSDTVTVNDLAGTDVLGVAVDLAASLGGVTPDGAADTVIVNATGGNDTVVITGSSGIASATGLASSLTVAHADPSLDRLILNLLAGDDVCDASGLVSGVIQLTIDGGDNDDVLTGSAGNDTILGGNGDDVLIGGPGTDVLDGGPGSNIIIQ